VNKWISTKDEVPSNNMNVLVTTVEGYLEIAFYEPEEGWHLTFNGYLFRRSPVAWQLLPKAYEVQ